MADPNRNIVKEVRAANTNRPVWKPDLLVDSGESNTAASIRAAPEGGNRDTKTYWEKTAPWYYRTFRKNHNGVFISVKSTRNPLKILYWRWIYERIPES